MKAIWSAIRWVFHEAWEKINVVGTYRELKELGKKHGRRFFIAAVVWELIEDVVFPFISWLLGVPELIPLFLVLHFEPIAYPAIFWGFRMWDRYKGREPWEPDRSAMSAYWRSALKVGVYNLAATGWFVTIFLAAGISPWILAAYVGVMSAFGFIHERIWHDNNFGIRPDDTVEMKRVAGKALTYRIVSLMTLYPLLKATQGDVPWTVLLICQAAGLVVYGVLETIWAKSPWGVSFVNRGIGPGDVWTGPDGTAKVVSVSPTAVSIAPGVRSGA